MCNERSLDERLLRRVRRSPLLTAWGVWRLATSAATTARTFHEATSCQAANPSPNPNPDPNPNPNPNPYSNPNPNPYSNPNPNPYSNPNPNPNPNPRALTPTLTLTTDPNPNQAAVSLWYARMRRKLFASSAYAVAAGHHGLVCLHLSFAGWLGALLLIAQHKALGQLGLRHYVVQHMQMALRRWSYRAIATKVLRAQHMAQQEEGWPERPHSPLQF